MKERRGHCVYSVLVSIRHVAWSVVALTMIFLIGCGNATLTPGITISATPNPLTSATIGFIATTSIEKIISRDFLVSLLAQPSLVVNPVVTITITSIDCLTFKLMSDPAFATTTTIGNPPQSLTVTGDTKGKADAQFTATVDPTILDEAGVIKNCKVIIKASFIDVNGTTQSTFTPVIIV